MEIGSESVDEENYDEEIKCIQNPSQDSGGHGVLPSGRFRFLRRRFGRHAVWRRRPSLLHNEIQVCRPDLYSEPSATAFRVDPADTLAGSTIRILGVDSRFLLAARLPEYARPGIRQSTARHCRRDPPRRTDSPPSDEHSQHPDLLVLVPCRVWVRRQHPTYFPMGRVSRRYPERHIATPIHEVAAFRPKPRKHAHLRERPRSPACCPLLPDTSHFASHEESSNRPWDGSGSHPGTS